MKLHFLTSIICLLLVACITEQEEAKKPRFDSKEDLEQSLILSHQSFLRKEQKKIEGFIESSKLDFRKTGTGLRYFINSGDGKDSLKIGDIAVISYTLCLLNGDTLYESPKGKVQEFAVDYDNVERGLHEGIKYMRVGDSGVFVLPAHLAHGITGDQAAIPSQATLVYYLKLLAKK